MKTRLKKLLEYSTGASKVNWSYTPSDDPKINIDRLTTGLPPFREVSEDGSTSHLKTLIISLPLDLDSNQIFPAQQRIKALIAKGHPIWRCADGELIPFTIESLDSDCYKTIIERYGKTAENPLTKQTVEHLASTTLSLPADALTCLVF